MEDKQVELGAEGTQQAVETTEPQPSLEELRQAVEAKETELQRKETEIKRLQGVLRAEQQRGAPKAELESIAKRIDDQQVWYAEMLDDLARRLDTSYEEPRQERKSYTKMLEEKRQAQPQQAGANSPEVTAFFDYLTEQGLTLEDDVVKEALDPTEDRTPKQAMKFLKEKVKTQQLSEVERMVETRLEEKLKGAKQAWIKELGLTSEGPGAPSALGGGTDDEFMQRYSRGETDDHTRASKILAKLNG